MNDKPLGLSGRALVRKGDRYLVIRRHRESDHWPGEWEICGGKTDPGESFDVAILRETKEEAGIEIRLLGLVGASEVELPHVKVVYLVMDAEFVSGEVRLSDEHEDHRWVTAAELAELSLCEPIAAALGRGGRI